MGDKLWPTFKNSQCQLNRLLKVPLGSLLLHNELTDNTRSTLHVLNIVVYTLHSDFYQYTSLETMTHVFETHSFGKNEIKCSYAFFFTTSKHICLEQLSWPRSWIWLAAHVSAVTEHLKHTFLANQRQQKQFFLQLEICMQKVCFLKISQSRLQQQQLKELWRKFEGRCFWISYSTPSNFTIRIPPQL